MTDIKWQEPPAGKGRASMKWSEPLAILRSRPGEWALIGVSHAMAARNIKIGVVNGADPGEFDATTRRRPDGRYDIYARFVGEVSA